MSGIAGVMTHDGSEAPENILIALSDLIDYRGPCDTGIATQGHVGLIHKNLQNISQDIGHQPLSSPSQLSLVLDGFISNYQDLKTDFVDKYPFETPCMGEVAFPLYNDFGAEFTRHLEGMHALALYDGYADELILSRDISGVKPLYYTWIDHNFIFSSSLQSLLTLKDTSKTIDLVSLKETLQYQSSIGENTIGEDIKTVMPGQTLILHKGQIIKTFQTSLEVVDTRKKLGLEATQTELKGVIERHLFARIEATGVPGLVLNRPGDYLLASLLEDSDLNIEIRGVKISGEESYADRQLHDQHDVIVDEGKFWRTLPFVVDCMEEPSFQPDFVFDYVACQELSKNVKTIISGYGAKLVFGDIHNLKKAKRVEWLGGQLAPKIGQFSNLTDSPLFLARWRERLADLVSTTKALPNTSRFQKAQLIYRDTVHQKTNLRTYESMMSKLGREAHCLFHEKELASLVLSYPDAMKCHHGQQGYLLYEMLRSRFGGNHPGLQFNFRQQTLDSWLQHKASRLGTLVAHQPEIEALFSNDFIRSVFSCKTKAHTRCAWALLIYAMWHQKAILGVKPIADTLSFLSSRP